MSAQTALFLCIQAMYSEEVAKNKVNLNLFFKAQG